jgi:hypothetical protein
MTNRTNSDIKPGDWVQVKPEADIPPMFRGGKPTVGRVECLADEGAFEVWVPIDGADVDEHSQATFYREHEIEITTKPEGQSR